MNYILYAIPFFFLLIALELLADRWRGISTYRLSDSINSLSAGVLSQASGLLTKGLGLIGYLLIWENIALFQFDLESPWVWVLAFVLYDLCYYWNHRIGHERNVFWASHVVHHQSEDYNLTTALRQSSSGFLLGWIFYLPMALIGIPPVVLVTVGALNLLYQFWVHTRHIPKLGWFEWFFITPSNHRVHHGQNPRYMDRNYGGVFIVWDRLFGTFQEELDEEPVIYGVTTPLASWNPLWANLHFYVQLWRDAVRAASWWDKLRIWFMPTGWRPADVAARYPLEKHELRDFIKFDVPLNRGQKLYAALQFAVYVLGITWLLMVSASHGFSHVLVGWCWAAFGLYAIGVWLENRALARRLELARLLLNVPALWLLQQVGILPAGEAVWLLLLAYSLLSGLFLWLPQRRERAAA